MTSLSLLAGMTVADLKSTKTLCASQSVSPVTQLLCRVYPGSEFVVANTLVKWKKLEPSETNLNQGFSKIVVSTNCFVFNSLSARGHFSSVDC